MDSPVNPSNQTNGSATRQIAEQSRSSEQTLNGHKNSTPNTHEREDSNKQTDHDHDEKHQNGSRKEDQDSKKDTESQREPPRSRFAAALQTFSPVWFAIVMNSGILGIIMHQSPQPYSGYWWRVCSYILYVFSLILFCTFLLIFLLRAILYPKSVPGPKGSQPPLTVETTAISACMPIAAHTLISHTILIVAAADWNGTGHNFTLFCYAAWWATVLWVLVTAQTTLVNMTRKSGMSADDFPPACIIPGVGLVTSALVGAVIVTYGRGVSAQLATPVIIVGYVILGWGIFWAIFMYPIFLIRFLDVGWPAPEKLPSVVFLIGPPGQAAGALVALGTAAEKHFPSYGQEGPIYTVAGSQALALASILLSFMFLGLYALWLIFSLYGILEAAYHGKFKKFTFLWWGTIFPTATGNLAFTLLATEINSQAFALFSCIWLVVLFIDFFCCLFFTVKGIIQGDLMDGREEEEKEARRKID